MLFLAILAALLTPRVAVILLWVFSRWFEGPFSSPLLPFLGFLFLPTTLLWYTVVHYWFAGAWTLWIVVGLVLALATDLSPVREHYRLTRSRAKEAPFAVASIGGAR